MPDISPVSESSLRENFQTYERDIRVRNYRLCAILASLFMLVGASLDWVVYGWEGVVRFGGLRVFSAVVLMAIWAVLMTPWGRDYHRALGLVMAMPLIFTIAWMIYVNEGANSPYYAGLNLVMLGAAVLMRWSLMDSITVVCLTLAAYLLACFVNHPAPNYRILFNNLYFLFVTGVFTTAGTWFYNSIRLSEFRLRYDLDRNRDELEKANTRLADSNEKLRELDEVKSRFFANVSHELRTPLTLLIAPIEAMLSRADEMSKEDRHDMLTTMHGNSMRLLKLINDLLDLVRLESGKVQVRNQRLNLENLMHGLANAVKSVANDKRIRLETRVEEGIGFIMADAEKLERISLNLLFNAIKFTAGGGRVVFAATKEDGWLLIQVRDTGMGIAPEQLPHVFNRFWQADTSSQRKFQGMGIGLALVKELAEAQGGSVSVDSQVGEGTVMSVRLPLEMAIDAEPAESPEKTESALAGGQEWIGELYRRAELFPAIAPLQTALRPIETEIRRGSKPKLLIADDEPDMLRFLKGQLSMTFDVLEAVDGHQAVEKAAQFLPDIILSDIMMPEKDGLQVCRELRDRSITRNIPVVLLTARADEQTKIDCLAAGASDFLTKPFSMTEIRVRLKNLVDARSYQRELFTQKQQLEATLEQLKEAESVLVQNEKLASLGRLSAGLIHEINNPLNYARQGIHILGRSAKLLPEDEREDFLDTVKDVAEGVDRVVQIISDLRGFTRQSNQTDHSFDLKTMVETGMRFFAHVWKDGVTPEVDVAPDLNVRADSNQFVQVFINLVQNALDAIETKQYPVGEQPLIHITGQAAGDEIMFVVRDNGSGISSDVRDKIFDPFFTTKDVGKGMGLGLSICNRIMAENHGRIDVRSQPSQFTEFILAFPSADSIIQHPAIT